MARARVRLAGVPPALRHHAFAVLAIVLLASFAGCTSAAQRHVQVLSTFYPVGFFASEMAGTHMTTGVLVPAGVEPHDYELTPPDVAGIKGARLVVYHGAELETFADQIRQLAEESGVEVVEAAADVPTETRDLGEEGRGLDPHLWLDPIRASLEARNIAAGLQKVDPMNATSYQANLAGLETRLDELDADFASGLAGCGKRKIITTHSSFGYVADRYDFLQFGISGFDPEAEPSAEKVREMADLARRENITVIFFETLVSPKVAKVIADEIGGRTEVLDPIEGLTPENQGAGKDYFSIMRENLASLRVAMECP